MSMRAALFLVPALTACALGAEDNDSEAPGAATAETANDGKTDGELRVRAAELTMWIDREIELSIDPEDHELVATIHGRASRNLVAVSSWVPDDAFGTATIVGPRSFDVALHGGHEINSILSGLPLFVSIDVVSGTPRHYEARLDLEAGLARFTGTTTAWVDGSLDAVYAGPPDEPLRYRAGVRTASTTLTIGDGGGFPDIVKTSDGFTVAWNYPDIEACITDETRVVFQLDGGATKSARFELRASRIGLTTEDPTAVWPSVCTPDVFACISSADDLSGCGSYREVQRCIYADACEVVGSSPLALDPLDLGFVWAAQQASYLASCDAGGQWCGIDTMAAFMTSECLAEPATLAAIVTLAFGDDQDWGGNPFARGTVLDHAGLAATPLFGASYSPGGPALLAAIDAHMANGPVEAWHLVEEVPCPNCHDFRDAYVLWYPEAFRVIVIEASHGYDS